MEGLTDLRLVLVRRGGVDVAIARLQRAGDDFGGVLGRHLEDAEAELGDFRVAAQRNARHLVGLGGHNRALPAWGLGKRFAAQPRSQPTGQSCGTLLTVNATVRERRSPVSRRASERRSRSRAPFFALGFLVILAAAAAGAAYVYDHGRSDRIAPGVRSAASTSAASPRRPPASA